MDRNGTMLELGMPESYFQAHRDELRGPQFLCATIIEVETITRGNVAYTDVRRDGTYEVVWTELVSRKERITMFNPANWRCVLKEKMVMLTRLSQEVESKQIPPREVQCYIIVLGLDVSDL